MSNTRRALLVGVNGYKPAIGQLQYSVADAKQVEQALNSRRDGFESTESTLLYSSYEPGNLPDFP